MLETDLELYLRLLTTPKPVFVLMIIYCRLVHQLEAKAIFLVFFFFIWESVFQRFGLPICKKETLILAPSGPTGLARDSD